VRSAARVRGGRSRSCQRRPVAPPFRLLPAAEGLLGRRCGRCPPALAGGAPRYLLIQCAAGPPGAAAQPGFKADRLCICSVWLALGHLACPGVPPPRLPPHRKLLAEKRQ